MLTKHGVIKAGQEYKEIEDTDKQTAEFLDRGYRKKGTPLNIDKLVKLAPDTREWEDKHYRLTERLLNDFKNKRTGYGEFIDNVQTFIKSVEDKAIERESQRILEGIVLREEQGYESRSILDSLKNELKFEEI